MRELVSWIVVTYPFLMLLAVGFGVRSERDLNEWGFIAGFCLVASLIVAASRVIPTALGVPSDSVFNVVIVAVFVGVFALVTGVALRSWLLFYLPASLVVGFAAGAWVSHREEARDQR